MNGSVGTASTSAPATFAPIRWISSAGTPGGHIRMVNSLNRLHSEMGPTLRARTRVAEPQSPPRSPQSHGRDDAKTPSAEATRDSSRRDNTRQLAVDGDVLPLGQGAVA